MPTIKRYVRRTDQSPVALQPRDHELLRTVHALGFSTAAHLEPLVFPGRSRRVVQARLRRLFDAGYLDRLVVPPVVRSGIKHPDHPAVPLYALGRRGEQLLRSDGGDTPTPITVPRLAPLQLGHDLVATDVLVTLALAVRQCPPLSVTHIEHEGILRARFTRNLDTCRHRGRGVVPDGMITITELSSGRSLSVLVEVVHVGVRAGNRTLEEKLARYQALNRAGFFRLAYGIERLRAVLIVARSDRHVASLVRALDRLETGRHLVWVTTREVLADLDPERILSTPVIHSLTAPPATLSTLIDTPPPPAPVS